MTWDDLADNIAEMTPEERQGEVKFGKPFFDCFGVYQALLCKAEEDIITRTRTTIQQGEWYLRQREL